MRFVSKSHVLEIDSEYVLRDLKICLKFKISIHSGIQKRDTAGPTPIRFVPFESSQFLS